MKFKDRLLQGTFIKRYKRFFVDINFRNKIITAHCPNTGSMMGLLNEGNKTWFWAVSSNYFISKVYIDKKPFISFDKSSL
jgi:DNA-binding sugar fermentation-stimulating protein